MNDHYRVSQRSGDYCNGDGEDWPCPTVRAAAVFIARACELWDAMPDEVKVVLVAEAVVNETARR